MSFAELHSQRLVLLVELLVLREEVLVLRKERLVLAFAILVVGRKGIVVLRGCSTSAGSGQAARCLESGSQKKRLAKRVLTSRVCAIVVGATASAVHRAQKEAAAAQHPGGKEHAPEARPHFEQRASAHGGPHEQEEKCTASSFDCPSSVLNVVQIAA